MRRQWDQDLSELCGGSADPDAGKLANRIEHTVLAYERALEAIADGRIDLQFDEKTDRPLWHVAFVQLQGIAREALRVQPRKGQTVDRLRMTDEQIKHMVSRFLCWRLPVETWRPDNGISYARPNYHPNVDATPNGTNLFDA